MSYWSLLVACVAGMMLVAGQALAQPGAVVSPEVHKDGRVTFRLRAPDAKSVSVRGNFWKEPVAMQRGDDGTWSVTVGPVEPGVWEYSFVVDGVVMIDPSNPVFKPQRQPRASVLHLAADPPAPWDFQDVPHGTVHQHDYFSKTLGRPRQLWVYTPPGYERDAAKRYPLLVLQHGSGDNHQTWVSYGKAHWILDGLIARGKAKPMVVVMLDGHPLGQQARETPPEKRVNATEAFRRELLEDALPLVESVYRVETDPRRRAIAGLSMGGGQALHVGLNDADRFAWVGAFSSGTPRAEAVQAALGDAPGTNKKLKLLWIACGKDDFLLKNNREFTARLRDAGVRHEWAETDGNHSWPVWRRYLADFAPRLFQE